LEHLGDMGSTLRIIELDSTEEKIFTAGDQGIIFCINIRKKTVVMKLEIGCPIYCLKISRNRIFYVKEIYLITYNLET